MPLRHVAEEGEAIPGIATRYGFYPETLWEHPENAELKRLRGDMNQLLPGDEVYVPDVRPRAVPAATGRRHTFRRRGIPSVLRLQLFLGGQPRAHTPYVVSFGDETRTGTTDADGVLRLHVPPSLRRAVLRVGDDPPIDLEVGTLGPVTDTAGLKRRLANLGFPCGDGPEEDDALRSAIAAFQARNGLPVTGDADDETRRSVDDVHGRAGALSQAPAGEAAR